MNFSFVALNCVNYRIKTLKQILFDLIVEKFRKTIVQLLQCMNGMNEKEMGERTVELLLKSIICRIT